MHNYRYNKKRKHSWSRPLQNKKKSITNRSFNEWKNIEFIYSPPYLIILKEFKGNKNPGPGSYK